MAAEGTELYAENIAMEAVEMVEAALAVAGPKLEIGISPPDEVKSSELDSVALTTGLLAAELPLE